MKIKLNDKKKNIHSKKYGKYTPVRCFSPDRCYLICAVRWKTPDRRVVFLLYHHTFLSGYERNY